MNEKRKERKINEEKMQEQLAAQSIVEMYAERYGQPTIAELNAMNPAEFKQRLGTNEWKDDYLSYVANAGLYNKLETTSVAPNGEVLRTPWGWKMEQIKNTLAYRKTEEGKRDQVRQCMPQRVRTKEDDTRDMIETASLRVEANTGNAKTDKHITHLNIERLDYIKMLEKSISEGGSLRQEYDDAFMRYQEAADNMISNEEAAKRAMSDKRRKILPALLLSWIVMPLYVILKSFDLIFDSLILAIRAGFGIEAKVGSEHKILGRLSIPLTIGTFISFLVATLSYNAGSELYVEHGVLVSGLIFIPVFTLGFSIVKQFFAIPFLTLSNAYGHIAEWASQKFVPMDADDYQVGLAVNIQRQINKMSEMIVQREDVAARLKDRIRNNMDYCGYDSYQKVFRGLTIKDLNEEARKMEKKKLGRSITPKRTK